MKKIILLFSIFIYSFFLKSQDIVMFKVTNCDSLNKITWVTESQENNDIIILQKKINNKWVDVKIIYCTQTYTPTAYTIIDKIDSNMYKIFKININRQVLYSYINI